MRATERRPAGAWLWLALLLALAAGLRLYRLGTLPAGLHFDEAAYGMLALDVLGGKHPVFFSAYAAREAGYPYLVALAISALGRTILAIRLPAALAGIGTVLAIFLLGRRALGTGAALLAAGAAAGAPWLLHLNRIGFRSNLLPLTLTLWGWLLLRALERNRRSDWLAAGVLLGLTAHTYLASRFTPILVLLFLGYLALAQRALLRRSLPGLGLMLLAAALLALPLAVHFLRVPADWGERTGQIWACAGLDARACAGRIAGHAAATFAMVGWRGDALRVFNTPGAPALPLAVGWLFYPGVVLALRRWREPGVTLLLLWWVVMALPGILSADSPSYVRLSGIAAPTMLLWALAPATLGAGIRRRAPSAAPWLTSAAAGLVLLVAALSAREYFGVWARSPELYYDFMGYATDAARAAEQVPRHATLYISEEYYRHPTYLYLAPRSAEATWFDARDGWPFAPPGRRAVYLISPATPPPAQLAALVPGAPGSVVFNQRRQIAYTRLEQRGSAPPAPPIATDDRIGGLRLEGFGVKPGRPGGTLAVTLYWAVRERPAREQRAYLHLVNEAGAKVAQYDAIGYPSPEWRPGDRFVSIHRIALPADLPPGAYHLRLGLYDIATFEAAPASGPDASGPGVTLPAPLRW